MIPKDISHEQTYMLNFLFFDRLDDACVASVLPTHPLAQELALERGDLLVHFDHGVRLVLLLDGGLIPIPKENSQ